MNDMQNPVSAIPKNPSEDQIRIHDHNLDVDINQYPEIERKPVNMLAIACLFSGLATMITLLSTVKHVGLAGTSILWILAISFTATGIVVMLDPKRGVQKPSQTSVPFTFVDLPNLAFPILAGIGAAILFHLGSDEVLAPLLLWLVALGASLNARSNATISSLLISLGFLFLPLTGLLISSGNFSYLGLSLQTVSIGASIIGAHKLLQAWRHNTQRDLVEKNLQNETLNARLKDFIDHSNNWSWETDRDHRLTFITDNFESVTGLKPKMKTHNGLPQSGLSKGIIIPELKNQDREKIQEALATKMPFEKLEISFPKHMHKGKLEPEQITFALFGKPLFSSKNEFLGFRGGAIDITQSVTSREKKKNYQSILEKKIQLRTKDLSDTLSSAKIDKVTAEKEAKAQENLIIQVGKLVTQAAVDILESSNALEHDQVLQRANTIKRIAENIPFLLGTHTQADTNTHLVLNLDGIALNTIHSLETKAEEKSINLVYPNFCGLEIFGEPKLIGKALYEIIHNAIDRCKPGGTITLITFLDASGIHISVKDQAPVINLKIQEEVASLLQKPTFDFGTIPLQSDGLGLLLAAKIMHTHQGKISFSRPENASGNDANSGNIVSLDFSKARLIKKQA